MTLTELSYIVALALEQHFGRAAERCHVSQPTLSIAVKKLEEELEVTLFERSKNGVQITTIGPYLLPQFIPLLQKTASQLSPYVEEGSQESLRLKLRNGELDAILVTAPFSEPDVVTQTLFDEPFVLLLPADQRLASKSVISAVDLDPTEILLLDEGDRFRDQVLTAFPRLSPLHTSGARSKRYFNRGLKRAIAIAKIYRAEIVLRGRAAYDVAPLQPM